jgi:hypothetical protein
MKTCSKNAKQAQHSTGRSLSFPLPASRWFLGKEDERFISPLQVDDLATEFVAEGDPRSQRELGVSGLLDEYRSLRCRLPRHTAKGNPKTKEATFKQESKGVQPAQTHNYRTRAATTNSQMMWIPDANPAYDFPTLCELCCTLLQIIEYVGLRVVGLMSEFGEDLSFSYKGRCWTLSAPKFTCVGGVVATEELSG